MRHESESEPAPANEPKSSTPFLDLTPAAQIDTIHALLFGKGALPRDEAVIAAAHALKKRAQVQFTRLRKDGPLWSAVDAAVTALHKQGRLDKPKRGQVRAVIADAKDYSEAHWQMIVKNALGNVKIEDEEEAVRRAADWAKENCGLVFERLRRGGRLETAISFHVVGVLS